MMSISGTVLVHGCATLLLSIVIVQLDIVLLFAMMNNTNDQHFNILVPNRVSNQMHRVLFSQ